MLSVYDYQLFLIRGYSYLDHDHKVDLQGTVIIGTCGTISVGTGIKFSGYYKRQTNQIWGLYIFNGVKTGGSKTYRYPGVSESIGNRETYALAGTEFLNNGTIFAFLNLVCSFLGKCKASTR